ncbi:MAG TPA: hypothetical protein VK843_18380 [Planctomycetota bacterium]|nr:hypothetical protein [Planctomycetota bacterium]
MVKLELTRFLRPCLLALLSTGLFGLSGCKQHFHPQYAHAIGGGDIGKGQVGKRRGFAARQTNNELGRGSSSFGRDPLESLLHAPGAKKGGAKKSPNTLLGGGLRAPRTPRTQNPLSSGKRNGLGGANPFANR